ncbi:uncharacterized protein LOC131849880 isoform X1 [Achroia grisella]|uniref:uncharacterized protein LOC131849880 isoform X1 n=1 Tax=Achroia grisella TaxID=688607 RepID=UPI0027D2E38A|nr:uncharacterized protein LOC131849880 isoform X1 [Achroia grisella]
MPRTKRPVKKQEKSDVEDEALKKLNKLVMDQKKMIDNRINLELKALDIAFKILLGSIDSTQLQKTVGQLKSELYINETATTRKTRNSTRSASQDDGYLTENSSQGSGDKAKKFATPASWSSRRSRSADASSRKPPATSYNTQRRRSRSVYRTPAYHKNAPVNFPPITPKVTPHTPLTVLRQPRHGEMVVSMSGSPVMVPACYAMQPDEKANCNILLQDGTMLSLQPKQLRQSQAYIPFALMDSQVLNQLKTLKDNLDKVVKLGEKAMK